MRLRMGQVSRCRVPVRLGSTARGACAQRSPRSTRRAGHISRRCSRPAGLELARQKGFPISDEETLFSTPQDLAALEALFLRHPYPRHRCHIRRGHGFLLLGRSLSEVEDFFEQHINPGPSTGTAAATHAGTCV